MDLDDLGIPSAWGRDQDGVGTWPTRRAVESYYAKNCTVEHSAAHVLGGAQLHVLVVNTRRIVIALETDVPLRAAATGFSVPHSHRHCQRAPGRLFSTRYKTVHRLNCFPVRSRARVS